MHQIPQSVYYYRLKIINTDGRFTYSSVVNIKRMLSNGYSLLTNPFAAEISINYQLITNEKISMKLFDANGRLIKQQVCSGIEGSNIITINNLSGMSAGNYYLQIISGKAINKEKLIKVK